MVDQSPWPPNVSQWGVVVTVLSAIGVVLDLASLRSSEGGGWDVMSILRLRNTRWLAAYGLVAAAVLANLFKVIQNGDPITSLPSTFLSSVLHIG
jgi:hypothetical protein